MPRRLLVLTLAALALLPGSAVAATMGSTVQTGIDQHARPINMWGFDVKQPQALADFNDASDADDLASEVFGGGYGMNLIRIPIRADIPTTVGGKLNSYYAPVVAAVQAAKAAGAAGKHPVRVYASKLSVTCENGGYTDAMCTATCKASHNCPDYSENIAPHDGAVNAKVYGIFLANYLEAMRAAGVQVDIIGPQNEPASNPNSKLDGPRINNTIQYMVERLKKDGHGGYRPRVSADDAAHPDAQFVGKENATQWAGIDYASTHFNSEKLDCEVGELRNFAAAVKRQGRNTPLWNTELHYTDLSHTTGDDSPCPNGMASFTRSDGFFSAKLGLIAAFQNFDAGVSGVVWWSYKPAAWGATHPDIQSRAQIQNALVNSTFYGRRLNTDDQTGGALAINGPLATRAFLSGSGKVLSVWMINDQTTPAFDERIVLPAGRAASGALSGEQWLGAGASLAPATKVSASIGDGGNPRVTLPPQSITLLRIALK